VKPYRIKEIYFTLQGEGANAGRAAVFIRFTGCNLWSGFENDRATAICSFCDTDFVGIDGPGGGVFENSRSVAMAAATLWPAFEASSTPLVVCTGGEPLLQLDSALIDDLHAVGFEIAVESNGTRRCPDNIDWICVSPKAGAELTQTTGDELKLVFPQQGAEPDRFASLDFDCFFLQPMDNADYQENVRRTVRYCLEHPQWRLSLQTHKIIGIP
jgi:7-carboxy-7-deazaguanine synthase (Cx14CxxC type)